MTPPTSTSPVTPVTPAQTTTSDPATPAAAAPPAHPGVLDPERVAALTAQRTRTLLDRTPTSAGWQRRGATVLPLGIASSFQHTRPYPIVLDHGRGSRVWDVDGNSYIDYHNGFGVMATGHAHPAIVDACAIQLARGTHFAAPTPATIRLAEVLCERFDLDQVRFANSGTEATMDAVRLARGVTGRDLIIKIEGSYHGHHDSVMVSVKPDPTRIGPRQAPASIPGTQGIPAAVTERTLIVPFNDPTALTATLDAHPGQVAAVIMEPIMMNVGIIPPEPGYLQAVRDACTRHGTVLIFDEVKTGATVAPGGAQDLYGVAPDLKCLAKAVGGGTPLGAFGGRAELMAAIADGRVRQQGTFNGNPLAVAAGLAALTEVLTPEAYQQLQAHNRRLLEGCQTIIDTSRLPAYTVGMGAKGAVVYSPTRLRDYRDYAGWGDAAGINAPLAELAWLFQVTSGIFMTPGADEQWTLSVQHTDADIDTYLQVFAEFADAVTRP